MERISASTGRRGGLSRTGICISGIVSRLETLSTALVNCPGHRLSRARDLKYSRLSTSLIAGLAFATMVLPQGKAMAQVGNWRNADSISAWSGMGDSATNGCQYQDTGVALLLDDDPTTGWNAHPCRNSTWELVFDAGLSSVAGVRMRAATATHAPAAFTVLSCQDGTGGNCIQIKVCTRVAANPEYQTCVFDQGIAARYLKLELQGWGPAGNYQYVIHDVQFDLQGSTVQQGENIALPNVALRKTATQSSTWHTLEAGRAVDGNTSGANPNLAANQATAAGEWWQVDLGEVHMLAHSEWFNRTDCCAARMNDYTIQRSLDGTNWTTVSHQTTTMASPSTIVINARARYIRLVQNKADYFNFAEVRLYEGAPLAAPTSTWQSHSDQAINCPTSGCLASGPGCDTTSVPGQCKLPGNVADAQRLCEAHPECVAVTCNSGGCYARQVTKLDSWAGFTSYVVPPSTWQSHSDQAINCPTSGCLASGPGCDTTSVPGQCKLPGNVADAQRLCEAHPECVAVTCNTGGCYARQVTKLDSWPGFTSYVDTGVECASGQLVRFYEDAFLQGDYIDICGNGSDYQGFDHQSGIGPGWAWHRRVSSFECLSGGNMVVNLINGNGRGNEYFACDEGNDVLARFNDISTGVQLTPISANSPQSDIAAGTTPTTAQGSHTPLSSGTSIFDQPLPTPDCDSWDDSVGDMANYVAREVNDMAVAHLDAIEQLGGMAVNNWEHALSGDFEAWGDSVIDMSNVAATQMFNNTMKQYSLYLDLTESILPDNGWSDFLRDAEDMAEKMGPVLIAMANPLNSVKGDISEIGGDLLYMLENVHDPEAFGEAWIHWQQQWNPVGSLTYLLTESDPMVGVTKAAARIQRQAEIFATYVAPLAQGPKFAKYAAKIDKMNEYASRANMVLGSEIDYGTAGGGKKQVLKNLIAKSIGLNEIKDQVKGFGKGCLQQMLGQGGSCNNPVELLDRNSLDEKSTARLNLSIARTFGELERSAAATHPFYSYTEIRDVPAIRVGSEKNFTLYRPNVEGTDCLALGDYAHQHGGGGRPAPTTLPALCGVSTDDDWWAWPIDYKLVWGDNCSGGEDLSIWQPVCPAGFDSVGFAASGLSTYRPSPERSACIKQDPGITQWADGNEAKMAWLTDDKTSGAKYDVTLLNREFAGIPMMYAIPAYPTINPEFLASLQVPVALGIPGPNGVFSTRVTFEVTTGNVNHAETDDPAFAILHNAHGDTHRLMLDNPALDDREWGKTDSYDVYRPAAFGKVTAFELELQGSDGWNISRARLKQYSKSLQPENLDFKATDWKTHAGKAIHCAPSGCISSGPGCGNAVAGQCSFPVAQAHALCEAHYECNALTCGFGRNDCQARALTEVVTLAGYNSYVNTGRWLDRYDGSPVQQFPDEHSLPEGLYSLQQMAAHGGRIGAFLGSSGDQVLSKAPNANRTYADQEWYFKPVSCDYPQGPGPANCYRISQPSSNRFLDGTSSRVLTRAREEELDQGQIWIVRRRGRGPVAVSGARLRGAYSLQQAYDGRFLDGREYGNAETEYYQPDDSQTWIIRSVN